MNNRFVIMSLLYGLEKLCKDNKTAELFNKIINNNFKDYDKQKFEFGYDIIQDIEGVEIDHIDHLLSPFNFVNIYNDKKNDNYILNNQSLIDLNLENIYKQIESDNSEDNLFDLLSKIDDCVNSEYDNEVILLNKIYALLMNYTSLIGVKSVNLFDYLRIATAINSCALNRNNKKLNIFKFDMSGIQNFIFKIVEGDNTKAQVAKSLRGRSFYVAIITSIIKHRILSEFELSECNVLFDSGDGATLLLPNCSDFEYKINKVINELQTALFKELKTDITFASAYVDVEYNQLKEFIDSDKAIELDEILERNKNQKFKNIIKNNNNFFVNKERVGNIKCQLCDNVLFGNEDNCTDKICPVCKKMIKISEFLTTNEKFYILYLKENKKNNTYDNGNNINIINIFDYVAVLVNQDNLNMDYEYIESFNVDNSDNLYGNIKNIANKVQDESLEQLANNIDDNWGDKKLGILKMDLDNLGTIFSFGIDDKTLIKRSMLSRLLSNFFSKQLINICDSYSNNEKFVGEDNNKNLFYINYAGGDDLVIIGPAAAIIFLASDIEFKFKDFVKNSDITISAGIHIQKPKEPIRFGVLYAEEQLEKSKNNFYKHNISIMDITFEFDDYNKILSDINKYKEWLDEKKISKSLWYNIYFSLKNAVESNYKNKIKKFKENTPRLLYLISKDKKLNKDIKDQLVKDITSEIITDKDLNKYYILYKLLLMFSREVM